MLVIGDLHFDNPVRYQVGERNLYLEGVSRALEYVIEKVAEEKEVVCFLGDFFEKKDRISVKVKNVLFRLLVKGLKEKGLRYYFVVGNHDIAEDGELTIEFLRGIGRIMDKKKRCKVDSFDVLFLPWRKEGGRNLRWDIGDEDCCDIVIGHFRLRGLLLQGSLVDVGGDEECYDGFEFKESKLIINGHYHVNQKGGLKDCDVNVLVPGSLVQVDFGEAGIKKFVYRLREDGIIDEIEVPLFLWRKVIRVGKDEFNFDGVSKESLKLVRFIVDFGKVDVEKLKKEIQKFDLDWYEIDVVRELEDLGGEINIDISREKVGIELLQFIDGVLSKISDDRKKRIFGEIIKEIL